MMSVGRSQAKKRAASVFVFCWSQEARQKTQQRSKIKLTKYFQKIEPPPGGGGGRRGGGVVVVVVGRGGGGVGGVERFLLSHGGGVGQKNGRNYRRQTGWNKKAARR